MKFEEIFSFVTVGVFISAVTSSVIPKSSPSPRPVDKPLSDESHFEGESQNHNVEYDHDAFLGKEEAKSFDQLTPEESTRRLGIIYEKIDADKDGLVSEAELQQWIRYVQKKHVETETNRQWSDHFANQRHGSSSELRWSNYLKRTYGTTEEEMESENRNNPEFVENDNKVPIARDKRRWDLADIDRNGYLTKEEFTFFVHPEEAEHTKPAVLEEALEDVDKDSDGFVSLQEYIDDAVGDEDEDENYPALVAEEEKDFHEQLDKDGDGRLNREEVSEWVIPTDYDHSIEESRHLFSEADMDKNGFLTKSEVIEKHDLFVGSQATEYGEALSRHDEF